MARKPRPVNPDEGPLQAFAYDLRKVREAAGDPTYRALAAWAGFSATTLSDAAGGVRKPSLEVTLAYVGACKGDVTEWERRWRELDALLTPAEVEPEPEPEPDAELELKPAPGVEPEPAADEPVAVGTGRHAPWPARWLWGSAAAAVALAVTGAVALPEPQATFHRSVAQRPVAQEPGCPEPGGKPAAFTGKTYAPVTRIRAAAALSAAVLRQVPAACGLGFTGYCIGDVVSDATSGSPDSRWFQLSGGGVVSSAVVHGDPPPGMAPTPCPGALPLPATVSLSAVPAPGGEGDVQLRATGKQLGVVGFAARYSAGGGDPQEAMWHQIAITAPSPGGFTAKWTYDPGPDAPPGPVPIVAAACLGGGSPTEVADALLVTTGSAPAVEPYRFTPADRAAAVAEACHYPKTQG